jgi:hypothetical protein
MNGQISLDGVGELISAAIGIMVVVFILYVFYSIPIFKTTINSILFGIAEAFVIVIIIAIIYLLVSRNR